MGDHITDDSGQTCSVFIPRLSSECGEYDINGGGDIGIIKTLPSLHFVFSVAVGCVGCETHKKVGIMRSDTDLRQQTGNSQGHTKE